MISIIIVIIIIITIIIIIVIIIIIIVMVVIIVVVIIIIIMIIEVVVVVVGRSLQSAPGRAQAKGSGSEVVLLSYYMRNSLGWLETGLAQNTSKYLEIA